MAGRWVTTGGRHVYIEDSEPGQRKVIVREKRERAQGNVRPETMRHLRDTRGQQLRHHILTTHDRTPTYGEATNRRLHRAVHGIVDR